MTVKATSTVSQAQGDYTGATVSVNGTLYVNNANSSIGFMRTGSKNGLRVASQSAGGITGGLTADVNQTAGAVRASNVYLGYGGTMTSAPGNATYVIQGDSTLDITNDSIAGNIHMGGLQVAGGSNQATAQPMRSQIAKFVVVGTGPTINVTSLVVGDNIVRIGNLAPNANQGTLEFKLGSGVSPINCRSVYLDGGEANSLTALVVGAPGGGPPDIILLANNTSDGNAVVGFFDTVNGGPAGEGAPVSVGGRNYELTYMYDAVNNVKGGVRNGTYNDIALLIPEPATIALFGLGLLAAVRRPRRK